MKNDRWKSIENAIVLYQSGFSKEEQEEVYNSLFKCRGALHLTDDIGTCPNI